MPSDYQQQMTAEAHRLIRERDAELEAKIQAGRLTVREFEAFLRESGRFSKRQAKALASNGWFALKGVPVEVEPEAPSLQHSPEAMSYLADLKQRLQRQEKRKSWQL